MKTRLLLIAFLAFGSTTLSNAQKDSAAASRPFYDYFYLEGNVGFFSVDLINYVYMSKYRFENYASSLPRGRIYWLWSQRFNTKWIRFRRLGAALCGLSICTKQFL
ncbi:MAG: hypothetical protein ACE362_05240 [Phaeodactylibacter xiamenensis]|uniref:Uncharacterized protein n=1 Tax=Phaeodactylibacter xiamenensis TaxID=1524460 RepID=A0A098S363_9BACT|nr:hypothetical protein [Phaeodactylibacter xiamenensis]KGE85632.1 hypothetical protein IX84_26455 [Phaeodactylibacter xiamenensis]MCR9052382.1 hypothetical protein [bacterium]